MRSSRRSSSLQGYVSALGGLLSRMFLRASKGTPGRLVLGLVGVLALTMLPGVTTCHTSDCPAVDVNGNPIVAPCLQCSVPGRVPCMDNVWYLAAGSTCLDEQRPAKEDGTACDDGAGVCQAGVCESNAFPCTEQGIRDAIAAGGGPHVFDCAGPTIVQTTAEIVIDNDVILDGGGNLIVDGQNDHRVFLIEETYTVELHNITVTGGSSPGYGAAFQNSGVLTVHNSTFSGNTGAIGACTNLGTLQMIDSTISNNTCDHSAALVNGSSGFAQLMNSTVANNTAEVVGGINNNGILEITDTTISGNVATQTICGGISNGPTGAQAILTNSSVVNNSAATRGGGICNDGILMLVQTTVSGNQASELGGGIRNVWDGAIFSSNSTIADNTALEASAYWSSPPSTAVFKNTLIQGSCQIGGTVTSLGYNLESPDSSCDLADPSDIVNVADAQLGQLQNNGGPTPTHAPRWTSSVINRIPEADCVDVDGVPLLTDQRGVTRPENTNCDIGSVEGYCIDCDDFNECTADMCDPGSRSCVYSPVADGTLCASGNGECAAGVCDHCAGVTCPDDGNECTDDVCEPSTGACMYEPVPDGTSCDSGNAECSSGACRGPEFIGSTWYRGSGWHPAVAMDPSGNGIAVWSQCDDWCGFGGTERILGRYYSPTDGWGSLFRIDNVDDSNALYPDVAMDQDGNAVAVWAQWFPGLGHVINASYYTADVGWDPPVPISEAFSGSDTWSWQLLNPTVRMDGVGRAVAVWKEEAREDYGGGPWAINAIVANTMSNGTWGTPTAIDNPTTDHPQASFDLAMAWHGSQRGADAMVVWEEYGQYTSLVVWARRYYGYSGWQDPVLLGDGSYARRPQVAMDIDGNAIAVWRETDTEIWTRRFSGSTWGAPEVLVSGDLPSGFNLHLDVAVPPFRVPFAQAEEAVVVWNENDNPGANEWTNLWAKRYTPSGGWGPAELLETHDGKVSYPQVALDVEGNAVATWVRIPDDAEPQELWINRYRQTPYPNLGLDGWTTAERIEFVPDNSFESVSNPEIAMVPYREGVVVWSRGPYAQNVRWTSAPAPTLSNGRSTHVPSSAFCLPNNYFRLQADYWDPDGDIASSTARVFVELFWSNSSPGFQQAYESESIYNQVSGNGFSGTVTANNCIFFGPAEWVDVTLTIWDAAQNESLNSVTMRVTKPAGAD